MARFFLIAVAFVLVPSTQAQTLQEFLSRVPGLPGNYCSATLAQQNEFNSKLTKLSNDLTARISEIRRESKQNEKTNEAQIKKNMMTRAGVDPAKLGIDPEALKGMSKEQRQEAASKMMKQATGMSLEDLKKLQQTELPKDQVASPAAVSASTGINPEAMKKLMERDNQKPLAAETSDLIQKQAELSKKLDAFAAKALGQISLLDNEPEMKRLRDEEIPALRMAHGAGGGGECSGGDAPSPEAVAKLRAAEQRYCTTQSNKYVNIMEPYWGSLIASVNDYKELDRLEGEVEKAATGLDKPVSTPGSPGIEALRKYLRLLAQAYKYDLRPDDRRN